MSPRVVRSSFGVAWGLVGALAAGAAHAAPLDDALAPTEAALEALLARAGDIEGRVAAGSGRLDSTMAKDRYELGLYHFLVGDWEASAEVFFVLAGRGTLGDPALQRDAEWYLAESLYQLRYDDMAAVACETIVAYTRHPYREEAVRRLLEVYARADRPLDFDRLFEREVLRGDVKPSDAILYAVGKSLRIRGERGRARSYLDQVSEDGEWSLRARYVLGAMLVEDGPASYRDAVQRFSRIAEADPAGRPEDVAVVDLARLALGRLHDALGDVEKAAAAYLSVPDDSPYAADRTRELVWLRVHAQDWAGARDAAVTFVERFPEHPYAAEQRLLLGHLQVQVAAWDAAATAYGGVVDAYGPVRDALGTLAGSSDAPVRLLDELGRDRPVSAELALPPVAASMLEDSPAVARALELARELERLTAELEASEALVADLRGPLGAASSGGAVEQLRVDAIVTRSGLLASRLDAVVAEQGWLAGLTLSAEGRTDLAELTRERDVLARDVERISLRAARVAAALSEGTDRDVDALERDALADLVRLESAVDLLVDRHRGLRRDAGLDVELDPTSARFASLHGRAYDASNRLSALSSGLRGVQVTELERLQGVYRAESAAVAEQRAAIDGAGPTQRGAAAEVVRAELIRLAAVFRERVMSADMGLANVAWSRWVEAQDTQKAASDERRSAVSALEARYDALAAPLEAKP